MPEPLFTWDPHKAESNRRKHGVTFEEASTVFDDPVARLHEDPGHSISERREIITGHSDRGRLLVVFFTERPSGVRVISARRATPWERRDYEEATETFDF